MAPQPPRREQRRTHLDASVVPVERALIARATALEAEASSAFVADDLAAELVHTKRAVAAEFRALAEELRYW